LKDRGFGMQGIVDGQDWPDDSDPVADYDGVATIPQGVGRATGVYPKPSSTYQLIPGSTYRFRMRTVSQQDEKSAWTNTATVYVPPVAAPTDLTAITASDTEVTLSWTNNATEQVNFRVEMSTDG